MKDGIERLKEIIAHAPPDAEALFYNGDGGAIFYKNIGANGLEEKCSDVIWEINGFLHSEKCWLAIKSDGRWKFDNEDRRPT